MVNKTNKLSVFYSILFIIIGANVGYSQDLGAWTSIGLEYKPTKKLSLTLEEEIRLKDNISTVDEYFTEIGAEYELLKHFSMGVGARYIKQNDTEGKIQGYEEHFRFQVDAAYKHKVNEFSMKYRLRYQNKNELGIGTSEGDEAKQNIRFKTSIDYNIKGWKLDPEMSFELFNQFGENEKSELNKYRLSVGTSYDMKDYGKINLYYQYEKELNETDPVSQHVIGLKYKYTFKK